MTLEKLSGPALGAEAIGEVDAVLLSHDQHADNLDHSGKAFLAKAKRVLTTVAGAKRLGGHAEGLMPWATTELGGKDGRFLTITATPARHGPAGIEPLSGDVIGFVLTSKDKSPPIYVSGDTVWYDGVAEVARRFKAGVVLPFAGAAQTRGPFHLTMDTNDTIETARVSGRCDRPLAHRWLGALPSERKGSARVIRYAWVWLASENPRARSRHRHRAGASLLNGVGNGQ